MSAALHFGHIACGYGVSVSRRTSRNFDPCVDQVALARGFVKAVVDEWGLDVPDAELVAGELAANAVVHARSRYTVTLRDGNGRVTIEVADRNVRLPAPAEIPLTALSGRGLAIVARLSAAWGVRSSDRGKVVWAELTAGHKTAGHKPAGHRTAGHKAIS